MNQEQRILMQQKKEALMLKNKQIAKDRLKESIITEIPNFSQKYRFAIESELDRVEKFVSQLKFDFPGHIKINEETEYEHGKTFLFFLSGSEEIFGLSIFGDYNDFIIDYDSWEFFSPFLLLIDDDFLHYTYIDDNQKKIASILNA